MTEDANLLGSYDLFEDGHPSESLDVLLGALGASRQPHAEQVAALQLWLGSPAAWAAPPALRTRAERFVSSGE